MRPLEVGLQPGSCDRTADNRTYGTRVAKTPMRCLAANKNAPRRTLRAMLAQVSSYRFSHVGRNRKAVMIVSLPTYRQYAILPVDVFELHRDDVPAPQSESSEQEQHRQCKNQVDQPSDQRISRTAANGSAAGRLTRLPQ